MGVSALGRAQASAPVDKGALLSPGVLSTAQGVRREVLLMEPGPNGLVGQRQLTCSQGLLLTKVLTGNILILIKHLR